MRKLLWGFVIVITTSIIILACQKELSSPRDTATKFDDKAAKEWYYGTFKKSWEWKSSSTKGKQLPDWKKGVYKKIGNFEIVEFPLVKQNRSIVMNANGSEQEKRRIAESTLDRIIFVKSNSGKITVRGIQFIPDINYLINNNYDISKNTLGGIDTKFNGILSIRTWNNKEIVRNNFKDGKVIARSYPLSSAKISASSRIECNGILISEWYSDCDIHITGSQGDILITVDCTPWAPTGNSWCVDDEEVDPSGACAAPSSPECFCELIGNCEEGGGGGGGEDCEVRQQDLQGNVESEIESTTITAQTPTTREKEYVWVIYKQLVDLWRVKSKERGVHVKVNNVWQWQSLSHLYISKTGTIIGGSISVTENSSHADVGIYWASMQVDYKVEASLVCGGSPFNSSADFTSVLIRNVDQ